MVPSRSIGRLPLISVPVTLALALTLASDGGVVDIGDLESAGGASLPDLNAPPCVHLPCAAVAAAPFQGLPADFVPDRRPVLRINLFGAQFNNGPTGQPLWWLDESDDGIIAGGNQYHSTYDGNGIPDSVDELLRRLDAAQEQGWRRIDLNMPAGQLPASHVPSSQWWTMPQWKIDAIEEHLSAWIGAHPDTDLSIYCGFAIRDPCDLQTSGAYDPDTVDPDDMCIVYQNFRPWLDVGVVQIWLDRAGGAPARLAALLDLNDSPNYQGRMRLGGEPAPSVIGESGSWVPDLDAMTQCSFMASQTYLEEHPRGFGDSAMWALDPETTEVGVAFQPLNPNRAAADIHTVKTYVDHGFVAWGFDALSAEYVRRVYGLGTFECPADLDAGGAVDTSDLIHMVGHWGMTDAVIYHGDTSGDGVVDIVDLLDLLRSWGSCD